MPTFSVLIETILIFLALMLVGYLAARKGVLDGGFSRGASFLVMNLFLVAAILRSVTSESVTLSGAALGHVMFILTVTALLIYLLAFAALKLFEPKLGDPAMTEVLFNLPNIMFVCLPILQEIYGPAAALYVALSGLPCNFLIYTYSVWRLNAMRADGSKAAGLRLRDIFSPCLISAFLAFVILMLKPPVPHPIRHFLDLAAPAATPLSMLIIGVTMGSTELLSAFREKRVYLVSLIRLVLAPLLVWLVLRPLTDDALLLKTCVVIAGAPCGILTTVLALQYGHDALLCSRSVVVTTLLSMITLPCILYLLG